MDEVIERTARFLAPVTLASFASAGLVQSEAGAIPAGVSVAVIVGGGSLLALLRTTNWVLVAGAVLVGAAFTVLCTGQSSNLGWFGICVLAGWVALAATLRGAVVFGAIAAAGFLVQWTLVSNDGGWGAWLSGTVFTLVACLMAGRQRTILDQLRAAQSDLADRTRADERTRIAREMHDVIGHALTVTLLHISSARLAMDDEPEVARAALDEAERHARRSLEDVRSSVGLLQGRSGGTTPLPGGADLGDLVDSFRLTGAPVSLQIVGDTAHLPSAVGLATYRIVQEALTNAARHAPGAATEVRVTAHDRVTIMVDSHGRAPVPAAPGSGLAGMRERALAVGGICEAGPADHGWRVRAELPA